jgi:four helix bundle protein
MKPSSPSRPNFENLKNYRLAEDLADRIWDVVATWDGFAKQTAGAQIVRAAESVGASLAEGVGRGSHADNRGFVRTARGSLYEALHFLRRAFRRHLLTKAQTDALKPLLEELPPRLNAYLNSIGRFTDAE